MFNFIARGFKDRLFRENFLINSSTGCSVDGILVIFGGPFPPRGGGLFLHSFSFWGHCFIFWGYFLYVGGGGEAVSTYIEKFLGLFPLPKIGAHGLLE